MKTVDRKNLSNASKSRLRQAMGLAELSDCNQRHGAILAQGGRVLSVGVNTNRNNPVVTDGEWPYTSVHAEVAALRAYGHKVKNGTMFVARITKANTPAMSKPCDRCLEEMKAWGVKKVVYTIDGSVEL